MKINKMPVTIYAQWYMDGNAGTPGGTYLTSQTNAEEASDADCGQFDSGEQVGIYKLVRVVKLRRNVSVSETATKNGRKR